MDFITPLPKTARGNAGLFVVVDRLSKFIRLAATPEHVDAPQVAQLFHSIVYRHHGLLHEIIFIGITVSHTKSSPTETPYL